MISQLGTGKTHTLVEIILHLLALEQRILVCGASNLSVDNILERLVKLRTSYTGSRPLPKMSLLRLSHPARTLPGLVESTLFYQSKHSEGAELAKDCRAELEAKIAMLSAKGGSKQKGGKVRLTKEERRKGWDDGKALRKESVEMARLLDLTERAC